MQKGLGLLVLTMALVAGCGDDGDDNANQNGGPGGSGGSTQQDGGNDNDGTATGDEDDGKGVHATGSFNGEAIEITCAPPSDLTVGTQFLFQRPADLFYLWQFRCRTADQSVQIWFDLTDPEAGKTYTASDEQINISLGDPMDVQPNNRTSENLVEMTVTVDAVDVDAASMKGSFSAKWEGGDKYGEIAGTFDVEGWGQE